MAARIKGIRSHERWSSEAHGGGKQKKRWERHAGGPASSCAVPIRVRGAERSGWSRTAGGREGREATTTGRASRRAAVESCEEQRRGERRGEGGEEEDA